MIEHRQDDQREKRGRHRQVAGTADGEQPHTADDDEEQREDTGQTELGGDEQHQIWNWFAPAFLVPLGDRDQAVVGAADAERQVITNLHERGSIEGQSIFNGATFERIRIGAEWRQPLGDGRGDRR